MRSRSCLNQVWLRGSSADGAVEVDRGQLLDCEPRGRPTSQVSDGEERQRSTRWHLEHGNKQGATW